MSPVDLLSKFPSDVTSPGMVRLIGGNGGFVVVYQRCDDPTLRSITDYQSAVRAAYPGWLTLFDFRSATKGCALHVFPMGDLPDRFLSRNALRWRTAK
jgi:hypothetical protein